LVIVPLGPTAYSAIFQRLTPGGGVCRHELPSLSNRDDLSGDTGLPVHPVREHYLVYLPVADQHIVIVAVVRQSRDVPEILGRAEFMIRREVMEIRGKIEHGELNL